MEGFVKALKKENLSNLKQYLFYLTYNNRADILFTYNPPIKTTSKFVNKLKKNNLLNNDNNLDIKNPYSTYFSYKNSIKKEWKENRVRAIELIMSYSKKLNILMVYGLGKKEWEEEYQKIVKDTMNIYFKKNKYILSYFHKTDSTGYRYHVHNLIYPYKYSDNGFSNIYNNIEPNILEEVKKTFRKKILQLIERHKKNIKKNIIKKIKRGSTILSDEDLFNTFLKYNQDIEKYFLEEKESKIIKN